MRKLNYIDLFAGAGGLSEGFLREGFCPIAHVEMNKAACETLKTRISYYYLKSIKNENIYFKYLKGEISKTNFLNNIPSEVLNSVINNEISESSINNIFNQIDNLIISKKIDLKKIDLIVGGPPCQAYSIVGRARDPQKMENDPRNYLYKLYIEFLKKYKPSMFVFENVPGILSAKNGEHFEKIKISFDKIGYNFDFKIINAKYFGVLQERKRVILIGWKKNINSCYPKFEFKENKFKILKDLFFDLPKLSHGQGVMGVTNYINKPTDYIKKSKIRDKVKFTTQHIARPNNNNDLEIYKIAVEKWSKGQRLNYAQLPPNLIKHKNTSSFLNRFQVVNGDGLSHTIVAHIAMDGHYYIHPDKNQNRSLTIREAARIQSFPDDYFFEGTRTSAFKQIGNAVPPLMSEEIAKNIKIILNAQ